MPFLSIMDMVVKYQVVVLVLGTGTCDLKGTRQMDFQRTSICS